LLSEKHLSLAGVLHTTTGVGCHCIDQRQKTDNVLLGGPADAENARQY